MTSDLKIMATVKIKKKCPCCGKEMEILPYVDQDLCDRCLCVVCKEVFNKENDNLTVEEVKERISEDLKRH